MRKAISSVVIVVFLGALLASPVCAKNGESGTSLLSFLKLGAGARAMGMGEAYTAQSAGAGEPFWNPAALSSVGGTEASFTHTQWLQDITAEHFSLAMATGKSAFGLGLSVGRVPDIEKRGDVPTVEPVALFDAHDVEGYLSYARSLSKKLAAGVSAKWLYEKIDISSSNGWAFDVGSIYSPFAEAGQSALRGLTVGAAILNLGSKMRFEKEWYSLPTQYKAGVSWFEEKKAWQSDLTLGLDLVKPRDDNAKVHLGLEYDAYRTLALRLGYQFGYDEKDLSFGMGIKFKKYGIDYAYIPYKSDLGDVHCISLEVAF
ncbi:MAG: PorV/PorQ family protein [Candidatus Zixiibacteriota bacterium]